MTIADRQSLPIGKDRSLAEVAYDEMLRLIREGVWATRTRLPSEADLALQFNMSRPVVRKALARLRDEGLIQSRQGSGSFVTDAVPPAPAVEPTVQFPAISSLADLDSFLNFREGLEVEASAAAARRHTARQLEGMKIAADQMIAGAPDSTLAQRDYQFHVAVAAASNNVFYANTLISLKEHMLIGLKLEWSFSGTQAEFRENVAAQHAAIIEAIERRDVEGARAAMRNHLQWARSKLVTGRADVEEK